MLHSLHTISSKSWSRYALAFTRSKRAGCTFLVVRTKHEGKAIERDHFATSLFVLKLRRLQRHNGLLADCKSLSLTTLGISGLQESRGLKRLAVAIAALAKT